jgi:hypothetical protein
MASTVRATDLGIERARLLGDIEGRLQSVYRQAVQAVLTRGLGAPEHRLGSLPRRGQGREQRDRLLEQLGAARDVDGAAEPGQPGQQPRA